MLVIWMTFWSMCSSCTNKGAQQSQRWFQRHQYNCLPHNLWDIFTFPHSDITKVVINVYHGLNVLLVYHMVDHNPQGKTISGVGGLLAIFSLWSEISIKIPSFLKEISGTFCMEMLTPINPGLKLISFYSAIFISCDCKTLELLIL